MSTIQPSGGEMKAITISRQYGSGGGEIGARLAQRLNWHLIDHEIVARVARELGIPEQKAEVQDEYTKGFIARVVSQFVSTVPTAASPVVSESPYLLTEMLRDEWGFDGVVVSDWYFSVKSTAASVNAGLEMPAPEWRGEKLLEAVQRGEVAEATIDASVRRLLHVLVKAGVFAHPELAPEQTVDLPESRALVREAGAEGIVLPTPLDRGASISDRLTRCVARSALPLGIRYSLRVRQDERWQNDRQSSFKTRQEGTGRSPPVENPCAMASICWATSRYPADALLETARMVSFDAMVMASDVIMAEMRRESQVKQQVRGLLMRRLRDVTP